MNRQIGHKNDKRDRIWTIIVVVVVAIIIGYTLLPVIQRSKPESRRSFGFSGFERSENPETHKRIDY